MATLYQLTEQLHNILSAIDDNDGLFSDEELLEAWEETDGEINDKIESWCKAIKCLKSDEDKLAEEIRQLKKRKNQPKMHK